MEAVESEQVMQFELAFVVVTELVEVNIVIEFVQSKQTSLEDETKLEPVAHPVDVNPTIISEAVIAKLALTVKMVDPL